MSRPNILVIQADQLTSLCLSAYGKPYAITPNIDKIAQNGTTFTNSYCNNPVCGPSRASMMTGRLPSDIGVFDNGAEFLASEPTFAHYLRTLGYKTTLSGKMHFVGPDQLHGFEERLTTDIYPSDFAWTADWDKTDEPFAPSVMSLLSVVEAGYCERNLQIDYDEEVFAAAKQEMYNHARSTDDRPFMLHVSFTQPHNPFVAGKKYWDMYEGVDISEPEVAHIPYEERDAWAQRYYLTIRQDEFDITPEQLYNARRGYFAMCTHFDEMIGGLIETLESIGELENTYIFITSDHGEMLGERGMWFKQTFWEWSAHVPFIASVPGIAGGGRSDKVVSLVDLLPTFLDLAGADSPDLAGNSVLPLMKGNDETWPDIAISDYLAIGPCVPCRMVRKGRFKFIYTHGHPALLYDLDADPSELNNLAADAAFADVLADLSAHALTDWDPDALTARVLKSQQQRKVIKSTPGAPPQWDFIARKGDEARFVRAQGVDATKSRLRLPQVPEAPADWPELDQETVADLIAGRQNLDAFLK